MGVPPFSGAHPPFSGSSGSPGSPHPLPQKVHLLQCVQRGSLPWGVQSWVGVGVGVACYAGGGAGVNCIETSPPSGAGMRAETESPARESAKCFAGGMGQGGRQEPPSRWQKVPATHPSCIRVPHQGGQAGATRPPAPWPPATEVSAARGWWGSWVSPLPHRQLIHGAGPCPGRGQVPRERRPRWVSRPLGLGAGARPCSPGLWAESGICPSGDE